MATITTGPEAAAFPFIYFVGDAINVLTHSPAVNTGSTSATATWTQYFDDGMGGVIVYSSIVTFTGTGLNSGNGTITGMNYSVEQDEVSYQAQVGTGLSIDAEEMFAAISNSGGSDTSQLKAIFSGIDWTISATSAPDAGLGFSGTGGDDNITFGAGQDQFGLDGGNDTVSLGDGDDTAVYFNSLGYSAAGHSTINGGAGSDWFMLEYDNGQSLITHGMTVNLAKAVQFDDFSVDLKGFENLQGSEFTDTLVGTNGANRIVGNGGGDRMIGKGGADLLWGHVEVDDFFAYTKASDSKPGTNRDIIYAFEHELDVIDLKQIDSGSRNGAFKFVGEGALKRVGDLHVLFHNEPGTENDFLLVEANMDRDKKAEFQIEFRDVEQLTASDFIL